MTTSSKVALAALTKSSGAISSKVFTHQHSPKVINCKYQLADAIGKGAFGRVFRSIQLITGKVVVVKELDKRILQEQTTNVLNEHEILQELDHPNIIKTLDTHETPAYIYIILEYVEGGSLHDLMTKCGGPFHESLLRLYISQVLQALVYLHQNCFVHRDVKGANILLSKDGICKLADFGSCTSIKSKSPLSMAGSPFWAAPEIISGLDCTVNSDIWSVGCTIIELRTTRPPYWSLGPSVAMYRMTQDEHPPLPSELSVELEDFLKKSFLKDTDLRPSAEDLLLHPWFSVETLVMQIIASPTPEISPGASPEISMRSNGHLSSPITHKFPAYLDEDDFRRRDSAPAVSFPLKSAGDRKMSHSSRDFREYEKIDKKNLLNLKRMSPGASINVPRTSSDSIEISLNVSPLSSNSNLCASDGSNSFDEQQQTLEEALEELLNSSSSSVNQEKKTRSAHTVSVPSTAMNNSSPTKKKSIRSLFSRSPRPIHNYERDKEKEEEIEKKEDKPKETEKDDDKEKEVILNMIREPEVERRPSVDFKLPFIPNPSLPSPPIFNSTLSMWRDRESKTITKPSETPRYRTSLHRSNINININKDKDMISQDFLSKDIVTQPPHSPDFSSSGEWVDLANKESVV
eukprot:TRINITY_DN4026_c0_g1_i1.p1 TRINITY_DN4026_c0_g1~~TRINITY_DN4026_c0_g1_i1.p1  ORF type:complete len:632 (-),score=137.29 TRINITY_DN4026_c0_g1_i1:102-1997(-)